MVHSHIFRPATDWMDHTCLGKRIDRPARSPDLTALDFSFEAITNRKFMLQNLGLTDNIIESYASLTPDIPEC